MVDVYATGKSRLLAPQEYGYPDKWAQPLNSNFLCTNAVLAGTTTISTSTISATNPTVTLTFDTFATTPTPWLSPNSGQNLRCAIIGTIAFDITIIIPHGYPGLWIFQNGTSGGFKVYVKTDDINSNVITLTQGYMSLIFCDGILVSYADAGGVVANSSAAGDVPVGTLLPFGGGFVPSNYLACDGAIVSITTYPVLYSIINQTFNGGATYDTTKYFRVPYMIGHFLTGYGTVAGSTITRTLGEYQSDSVGPHSHPAASYDAGHTHPTPYNKQDGSGTGPSSNPLVGWNSRGSVETGYAQITTYVGSNTGTVETVPRNLAVNYIIRAS
jgi:microcystin-dependent protein